MYELCLYNQVKIVIFNKIIRKVNLYIITMFRSFFNPLITNNIRLYSKSNTNSNPSFYRRLLPSHLIALNSHEGKKMFQESLRENNAQAFFTLVQQFITQNEPSTCASATMAMILNSLKIDPGLNWKGIWRWYDDLNIKSITKQHLDNGLTLQEFHQLIALNNAKSMTFSPLANQQHQFGSKSSLSLFRNSVLACTRRSNLFLTLNFHRPTLSQTGTGHFSPVAAYNSKKDMALILDVAKFKYDSYWCSVQTIYEAFKPIDKVSNQSRGFLINKKRYDNQKEPESPLCFLELDFQLNQKLRERSYYKSKSIKFIVDLLNDNQMHSLLIPILYEFYTLQIKNKEQLVTSLVPTSLIDQIRLVFNTQLLSQQAIVLLSAYTKQDKLSTIIFLYLGFTFKHQDHKALSSIPTQQLSEVIRLISKCQTYVGVSVGEGRVSQ